MRGRQADYAKLHSVITYAQNTQVSTYADGVDGVRVDNVRVESDL